MKKRQRIVASVMTAAMTLSLLAGCGASGNNGGGASQGGASSEASGDTTGSKTGTMVFAQDEMQEKFSPFFAETVPDRTITDLSDVTLLTTDRTGAIVYKGIEGEKREYNGKEYTYRGISDLDVKENKDGTVDYNFTLKDGVKFADGQPLTVDDGIFTLYVLADPTYD
ncbi:MAG: ABC transporter substrate-binding protein, partial [Lachnospiraceae bacterium]|nr:ABC transporter substrate-binding protein [Lachnospiraceae bacterium]